MTLNGRQSNVVYLAGNMHALTKVSVLYQHYSLTNNNNSFIMILFAISPMLVSLFINGHNITPYKYIALSLQLCVFVFLFSIVII